MRQPHPVQPSRTVRGELQARHRVHARRRCPRGHAGGHRRQRPRQRHTPARTRRRVCCRVRRGVRRGVREDDGVQQGQPVAEPGEQPGQRGGYGATPRPRPPSTPRTGAAGPISGSSRASGVAAADGAVVHGGEDRIEGGGRGDDRAGPARGAPHVVGDTVRLPVQGRERHPCPCPCPCHGGGVCVTGRGPPQQVVQRALQIPEDGHGTTSRRRQQRQRMSGCPTVGGRAQYLETRWRRARRLAGPEPGPSGRALRCRHRRGGAGGRPGRLSICAVRESFHQVRRRGAAPGRLPGRTCAGRSSASPGRR